MPAVDCSDVSVCVCVQRLHTHTPAPVLLASISDEDLSAEIFVVFVILMVVCSIPRRLRPKDTASLPQVHIENTAHVKHNQSETFIHNGTSDSSPAARM